LILYALEYFNNPLNSAELKVLKLKQMKAGITKNITRLFTAIELAIYGEEAQKDIIAQLINRRAPTADAVGGAAVGGAAVGGAAVGGAAVGGAAVGGAAVGGAAVGGAAVGGAAVDGAAVGGAAVGGAAVGGAAVDGAAVGGAAVGGAAVGGAAVGGAAVGGAAVGGAAVGGAAVGGAAVDGAAVDGAAVDGAAVGDIAAGGIVPNDGVVPRTASVNADRCNRDSPPRRSSLDLDDRSQNSDTDEEEGTYGPRLNLGFMNRVMLGNI
jgi:hypothetical protein